MRPKSSASLVCFPPGTTLFFIWVVVTVPLLIQIPYYGVLYGSWHDPPPQAQAAGGATGEVTDAADEETAEQVWPRRAAFGSVIELQHLLRPSLRPPLIVPLRPLSLPYPPLHRRVALTSRVGPAGGEGGDRRRGRSRRE